MKILIGVTGGISAYKAADLIGALKKYEYEIKVIMTNRAKDFITPLTLSTLSKNPVYDDTQEWAPHGRIDHIELAEWADLFVIAPATANTIAKIANGIADNLLTSTYLAFDWEGASKFLLLCPAMNTHMYVNEQTTLNIQKIINRRNHVLLQPDRGMLACGKIGVGKLSGTRTIIEKIGKIKKWLEV